MMTELNLVKINKKHCPDFWNGTVGKIYTHTNRYFRFYQIELALSRVFETTA